MRRIAIKLEYDGADFDGWQLQDGGRTVQGALETAVQKATGAGGRVVVQGASRTDAGVHAQGQVAHFDTESALEPAVLVRAINHWLPQDVSCLQAADASQDFHARFSARGKLYCYRVLLSAQRRPLIERYCVRVFMPVELSAMQACAQHILGEHDFASFASESDGAEKTVRTVARSEWVMSADIPEQSRGWHPDSTNEIQYLVEADGFLYNMVRALVGTMLEVGRGKITVEGFARALDARDRKAAGPTAPAHGLTLVRVNYPPQLDPFAHAD